MNSVPFGFAYGIWVRNQLGFLLCAVGLVTMALFYPLLFALSKARPRSWRAPFHWSSFSRMC